MAQGGSGFYASRLSTGDRLVLGAAGVYFIWSFLPFWYRLSIPLGELAALVGVPGSRNGFRGPTLLASLLALLAAGEVGATKLGAVKLALPVRRGLLQLAAGLLGLLLTVLGLVTRPEGYAVSWGLFVGLIVTVVWAYGAYMMYSEPEGRTAPPPAEGGPSA